MADSQPKCFALEISNVSPKSIRYLWIPIFSMILLGGCTNLHGLHLHNSADEELARKASDSFKAADVGAFIESQRKALAAANERDLAVTRRNVMAERDAAIITALGEKQTAESLRSFIDGRLTKIGFPVDDVARKAMSRLEEEHEQAMVSRDLYLAAISRNNLPVPSFPPSKADIQVVNGFNGPDKGTIKLLFNKYQESADQYFGDLKALQDLEKGLISDLNTMIRHGRTLQKAISETITAKRDALDKKVKESKDQVKDSTKDIQTLRDEIMKALDEFDKVTDELTPWQKDKRFQAVLLENLLAVIHLEKLKVARNQVGEFIREFSKESSAEAQMAEGNARSKADIAGHAAAILVKATKEIQDSSARGKLVPLIFEQERLKLEIEREQRAVDRGAERLDLIEKQRAALIAEGFKLIAASKAIGKASKDTPETIVKSILADPVNKSHLVHACLVLAESIAIDKLREEEIEVALISLDHEQALDTSEYALNLWKHVIASPLEELVGYHASGLTSEDIANLIHAAGLAGIAVGVNR